MRIISDLEVVNSQPVPQPELEPTTLPMMDEALSLACRIRIARENLAAFTADLEIMYPVLAKQFPAFGEAFTAVRTLPTHIAEMEVKLKAMARSQKAPLDLRSQGVMVAFSNPMRELVDVDRLLALCPSAERLAPEVFEHVVRVDPKRFNMAIASGVLPEVVKGALKSEPTTSEGRVELKYTEK